MDEKSEKYRELGREMSRRQYVEHPLDMELADMLRYALGEAYGMIERGENMYNPPEWMEDLWNLAFIKLASYRSAGLLPNVDYWGELLPRLAEYMQKRRSDGNEEDV